MTDLIITEAVSTSVRRLTLNRPDRRNALSIALLQGLHAMLKELENDERCRVVILQGAGGIFSSGLELTEAADPERTVQSATEAANCMRAIQLSPLVFVAAVQGGAYAGGAALMASCDIIVATQSSKFSFPAARRGLLPSLIFDLIRTRVSDGNLRDLFLTAEPTDALSAQRIGLVQRVVRDVVQLDEEATRVALAVTAGAPETIRQTKALIRDANGSDVTSDQAFAASIDGHLVGQNTDEAREGIASFLEKRDPFWLD